jgi:hypothetical protein
MFLFAHQFSIFFLFSLAPPLSSSSALAYFARLGLLDLFFILAVDFGENLLDMRVWVRVDEMAEQVCEAEEVSEAANCVIFLLRGLLSVLRLCAMRRLIYAPLTRLSGRVSCRICSCAYSWLLRASCVRQLAYRLLHCLL